MRRSDKRWATFRKAPALAVTYNFTPHWGLEADYGGNANKYGSENTVSIGPRFAWRSEGVMFFAHTLLGYNRLTLPLVDTSNGIGAILGGGMDLIIWRRLSLRLFEADYVWANHNFADEVSPAFPDLAAARSEGVRLRTGLVFNFGYPNAGGSSGELLGPAQRSHGG